MTDKSNIWKSTCFYCHISTASVFHYKTALENTDFYQQESSTNRLLSKFSVVTWLFVFKPTDGNKSPSSDTKLEELIDINDETKSKLKSNLRFSSAQISKIKKPVKG